MSPNLFLLTVHNDVGTLIPLLRSNPSLASVQDSQGYSLLHAATSYEHADLLRQLVREFGADVNALRDEDGDTALYQAETVEMARVLVEELGADIDLRNQIGLTAAELMECNGEPEEVIAYLKGRKKMGDGASAGAVEGGEDRGGGSSARVRVPPSLPPDVRVTVGTMEEGVETVDGEEVQSVDPEFKKRIEELAARDDFGGEEGQRQLRSLVTDAVREHVVGATQERDRKRAAA